MELKRPPPGYPICIDCALEKGSGMKEKPGYEGMGMVQRYSHHSVWSLRAGIAVLDTLKKRPEGKNLSQFYHSQGLAEKR